MLRITQTATEVIRRPTTASLRTSHVTAEVVSRPVTRHARTTHVTVEILRMNAAPATNDQQPMVIIVAG